MASISIRALARRSVQRLYRVVGFVVLSLFLGCAKAGDISAELDSTRVQLPDGMSLLEVKNGDRGSFPGSLPQLPINGEWKPRHTVQEAIYIALALADGAQTRWFLKHPNCQGNGVCQHNEQDVSGFFGSQHPSVGRLDNAILLAVAGHAGIAYLLPAPFRDVWQYVFIGIEFQAVRGNKAKGDRL